MLQKITLFIFSLLLAAAGTNGIAQTTVFGQLQGQPTMITTGWTMAGTAALGDTPGDSDPDNNELILTTAVGASSGAIFYNTPINLSQCTKWRVEFEFRIFDGNGADGLAFCFLDVPPSGFVSGGGIGIPATANGLKVAFDPYDNGCGANPEIQVYNGPGYNECATGIVKVNNTGGNLNFIRSNGYNAAVIDYNGGTLTVSVNGTTWITTSVAINYTGYMGFTAGTGQNYDNHSIRNVTIYADKANAVAGPDVAVCNGQTVQIGAPAQPNTTYSWAPPFGLSATNVANPTVNLTNTGATPLTVTYIQTATITGTTSCPTTDTVVVTINPTPTSNFNISPSTVCAHAPVTITYTGNMGAGATYTWNFGGGTVISGSGQGPYQVSWPTDGPKSITLDVSQFGCNSSTTTKNITVLPAPNISVTGPATICAGDTANYSGIADIPNSVFTWQPGNIPGTPVGFAPTVTTTYTVTAKSPQGCNSLPDTFTIQVNPVPVASITGVSFICPGDSALLQGSSTENPATYFWIPGSYADSSVWVSPTDTTVYQLVVTKDGCSSDTAEFTLAVEKPMNLQVPDSMQMCVGQQLTIEATTDIPASFDWQPGNMTGSTVQVSPQASTQYEVYAYTANCTTETKTIEVTVMENCECKLVIPNVFTPNGDSFNDDFLVQNPQGCVIHTFNFILYNRWGEVVWRSENIQDVWNGKIMNRDGSEGAYFWVFSYSYLPGGIGEPKTVTEKGTVTLFR
ncbi:MAG: gliding motility-associated C-terminal domain-containing protein [Flavobacteriales bacterium]